MKVDLTLYLVRESILSIEDVIPPEKLGPGGFEQVSPKGEIPAANQMTCWIKQKEPAPAAWSSWLEEGFDFAGRPPETQSAGAVVLIETDGRIFASCFGTGHHAVPREHIEQGFGLTVALHNVDPKRLRALITKTIELRSRQRDTSYLQSAELADFDIDVDLELLRTAEGVTDRPDCRVVAGADSLKLFGWNTPLSALSSACSEFLKTYRKGLPEAFAFVDSVRLVPKGVLLDELEGDLAAAIELAFFEKEGVEGGLSLQLDPADYRQVRRSFIKYRSLELPLEDLSDASLDAALASLIAADPSIKDGSGKQGARVRLRLEDAEGEEVLEGRLTDYLHMQVKREGRWFVRIERRWYECGVGYMEGLDRRVQALTDLSTTLKLPTWDKAIHKREADYNTFVATQNGWLLQDHGAGVEMFRHGSQTIEPCDLLTGDRHFIHVKDGDSSSGVTYALSQASGAAELLARHRPFVEEMKRRYETHWPIELFEAAAAKIVVAVGRHRGLSLFGSMLLSKIAVLEHARRIQGRGFQFAVCQFEVVEEAAAGVGVPTSPKPSNISVSGVA